MTILAAFLAGVLLWTANPTGPRNPAPMEAHQRPVVGLMSTLPIYWGEVAGIEDMLQGEGQQHWARAALESHYRLEPLDTLDGEQGIARVNNLILAQPRALSGPENVALDDWVRAGGRVLVFADPFLSADSRFPIGDRRRPQDVVLLSPILARWGLALTFDEHQRDDVGQQTYGDLSLPISLAGQFELREPTGGGTSRCDVYAQGLVARCAIGEGGALLVADATLVENGKIEGGRSDTLVALADRAFNSPAGVLGKSRD